MTAPERHSYVVQTPEGQQQKIYEWEQTFRCAPRRHLATERRSDRQQLLAPSALLPCPNATFGAQVIERAQPALPRLHSAQCQAPAFPPPTLPSCWLRACSEVGIFIEVPKGVRGKQLDVSIQPGHLRVGLQGLPPYLDVSWPPLGPPTLCQPVLRLGPTSCHARLQKDLGGRVRPSDSLWTLEDGVLHLQLAKAEEGATWASAISGAPPPVTYLDCRRSRPAG